MCACLEALFWELEARRRDLGIRQARQRVENFSRQVELWGEEAAVRSGQGRRRPGVASGAFLLTALVC